MDIIGIGSTFVDYFFEADRSFLKKYKLKPEDDFLFEELGITPDAIESKLKLLDKSPGGISTNTVAVLASLGIKTAYYGIIGKDHEGKFWEKNLNKLDVSKVKKAGTTSICFCILSNQRKHRLFLSKMNLKDNSFFKSVDYSYINNAKVIHVSSFLLDAENSIKKLSGLLSKINGPRISYTPALIHSKLGLKKLLPIIKYADILFLNPEEMKLLTKKPPVSGSKLLLKYGPETIICTMGEKGVLVTTKEEQFTVRARKVKKIVDSTGAGDAFAAGFLYGILKGKNSRWSAQFGNKVASKALSDFGLSWLKKSGLPKD